MRKSQNEIYGNANMFIVETEESTDRKFFQNFRMKLDENLGTFYQTYVNRVPLYIPDVSRTVPKTKNQYVNLYNGKIYTVSKTDQKIALKGKAKSIFQFPLVVQNEVVGIINVSVINKTIEVSKQDLEKLIRFSDQIAGVLYNAQLHKETEEAKDQANIEKGIALIAQRETEIERQKSEKLLLNILPEKIAKELKEKSFSDPVLFESASVLFTDFVGFTQIAEKMSPKELVGELDKCFSYFDSLMEKYDLEKLKTIGDSYMCAGGVPQSNPTHAIDCVLAALEIQSFMNKMKISKEKMNLPYWELRLGIHSGPLVAGVIGEKKFAYDVWGDTVNMASRMESNGAPGKINISGATYNLVKELFDCDHRGKINVKGKKELDMYFVLGIKPEYSKDRKVPNNKFWEKCVVLE